MSGDERRNLFTYATKELSQDAFLMWLFNNYDCENEKVREVSRALLFKFIEKTRDEKITKIETFGQWKHLDILVEAEIGGTVYLLTIEDKTYSSEHEQLKNYHKDTEKRAEELRKERKTEVETRYVFYKTAIIDKDEAKRIKAAGWRQYDIKEIYKFFSKVDDTGNAILDDYIAHVKDTYNLLCQYPSIEFCKLIGKKHVFERYCNEFISQKASGLTQRTEIYQGKYTATYLQKITNNDRLFFELAFFFRDEAFIAWFKCWENGKSHKDVNYSLREEIKKMLVSKKSEFKVFGDPDVRANRLLETSVDPKKFDQFSEFDEWVDKCIEDFHTIIAASPLLSLDKTN